MQTSYTQTAEDRKDEEEQGSPTEKSQKSGIEPTDKTDNSGEK